MIVSDHGMTETGLGSGVTYVKIEDYLDLNDVSLIVGGSFSAITQVSPHPGKTEQVLSNRFGRPNDVLDYFSCVVEILRCTKD